MSEDRCLVTLPRDKLEGDFEGEEASMGRLMYIERGDWTNKM